MMKDGTDERFKPRGVAADCLEPRQHGGDFALIDVAVKRLTPRLIYRYPCVINIDPQSNHHAAATRAIYGLSWPERCHSVLVAHHVAEVAQYGRIDRAEIVRIRVGVPADQSTPPE